MGLQQCVPMFRHTAPSNEQKVDVQCARMRPGLVENQQFLLGEWKVVHGNFSEAHSPTCYSSYLLHREASDRGMLGSDSKKIPKRRRRRRRDITEHKIQYGHKPLSQKCNLPISFAYLLIHLLLIWWNWGVVRVLWCKGFILQNNLQPTVQSL